MARGRSSLSRHPNPDHEVSRRIILSFFLSFSLCKYKQTIDRYCLDGELARDVPEGVIELKFHLAHDLNLLLCSAIYTVPSPTGLTKRVLCLVIKISCLSRYLAIQSLVEERVVACAKRMKLLLADGLERDAALARFAELLVPYTAYIDALFTAHLHPAPFSRTLFCTAAMEPEFLARCLTSHLQTHGFTIVVGPSPFECNVLINTLVMFLTPEERRLCRHCAAEQEAFEAQGYTPGLLVQGVPPRAVLRDVDLIRGQYPSTVIDLGAGTVRQVRLFHEYHLLRKDYVDGIMDFDDVANDSIAWPAEASGGGQGGPGGAGLPQGSNSSNNGNNSSNTGNNSSANNNNNGNSSGNNSNNNNSGGNANSMERGLLHGVKASSPWLRAVVMETLRLPFPLREGFISLQHRLLLRKTASLISLVAAHQRAAQTSETSQLKAKIKNSLGLTGVDLDIVLAAAEKLTPGIYLTVAGDLAALDEIVLSLGDAF